LAVEVHDVAAMFLRELRLLEKAAVVVVRHETNLHALFLVGGLQVAMARDFARVALGLFAQREQRPRQLVLPQREQETALVLAQIACAPEQNPPLTLTSATGILPVGTNVHTRGALSHHRSGELERRELTC